jgi:hypothetical protein
VIAGAMSVIAFLGIVSGIAAGRTGTSSTQASGTTADPTSRSSKASSSFGSALPGSNSVGQMPVTSSHGS